VLCAGQHACSELPPTVNEDPIQHAVQFALPTVLLKLPFSHGKHTPVSIRVKKKKYPGLQLHMRADTLPAEDTAFAGHAVHAALAPAENVSAGQSAHALEPIPALYLPAAHAAHVLRSDCSMYPVAHWHMSATFPNTCTSSNCRKKSSGT
jgi:hypothetical protein